MPKHKLWIQTDLGYAATKDKLLQSKQFIFDPEADYGGRLTFHSKDLKDVTYQLTTHGKIGIFYPETINPKQALEKLKPYLVKADGSPASIKHLILDSKEKPSPEKGIVIETDKPFNILYALMLMQTYPIKEIRVRKKSLWERIRDFLFEPSISLDF